MKCAIVADTVLIKKNNDFYSMTLTYKFLSNRYLKYYDEINLITRVVDKTKVKGDTSGYEITNGKQIEVNPIKYYKNIPDIIKYYKKIKEQMLNELSQCDLVIVRLPNILGLLACSICNKYNIKYYVEMLACPLDSYRNHKNKFGKIIAPIIYFLNKKALRRANHVLYVTNNFLQRKYPTEGNSINCSDVVLTNVSEETLLNRRKKINNLNLNDEIKIATVGNVGLKIKGHKYVIKAMHYSKNKNIKYYLIGNGDASYLKKLVKKYNLDDRVIFLGSVSHDNVFKLLMDMDLYIQPSLQEGMPRALLEAMSIGVPCIGSNVGGIPELLKKEFLFKKKDYKSIAKLFEKLNKNLLFENMKSVLSEIKKYSPENLEKKRDSFYRI